MINITNKTYYAICVLCAGLTALGGLLLVFGTYIGVLYNIVSILMAFCMMMMCVQKALPKEFRYSAAASMVLWLFTMVPTGEGYNLLSILGGALAWPVFAWPYFHRAQPESFVRKTGSMVFVAGAAQLVGSFAPLSQMFAAVLSVVFALIYGLFSYFLFKGEAEHES